MKRKAQAAMEYLMTYGWAILIVIIVAAALYALGVFNPATWTGARATGFSTIGAPGAWTVSGSVMQVELKNMVGVQINVTNITVELAGSKDYNDSIVYTGENGEIASGTTKVFEVSLPSTVSSGATYSIITTVSYRKTGATLTLTDSGTLTGTGA